MHDTLVFLMDTAQAWAMINQCFEQNIFNTIETFVGGWEKLERIPLKELILEEILRCLKVSAPDTGKSRVPTGL